MSAQHGVRVTVEGDLPDAALSRIAETVRRTVLAELAVLDQAPPLDRISLVRAELGRAVPAPRVAPPILLRQVLRPAADGPTTD